MKPQQTKKAPPKGAKAKQTVRPFRASAKRGPHGKSHAPKTGTHSGSGKHSGSASHPGSGKHSDSGKHPGSNTHPNSGDRSFPADKATPEKGSAGHASFDKRPARRSRPDADHHAPKPRPRPDAGDPFIYKDGSKPGKDSGSNSGRRPERGHRGESERDRHGSSRNRPSRGGYSEADEVPVKIPPQKTSLAAGAMLSPLPVVMVTCQDKSGKTNIITVAWTGIVCSDPPLLSISIMPSRYSHHLIKESGEFVVNLPTAKEVFWLDKFGVISGRDVDKVKMAGFNLGPSEKIKVPVILDCPVNLECQVTKTLDLGSHTMFLARILNIQVDTSLMDNKGRVALERAGLIAYAHGFYYRLGKQMGRYGFSVRRKKT